MFAGDSDSAEVLSGGDCLLSLRRPITPPLSLSWQSDGNVGGGEMRLLRQAIHLLSVSEQASGGVCNPAMSVGSPSVRRGRSRGSKPNPSPFNRGGDRGFNQDQRRQIRRDNMLLLNKLMAQYERAPPKQSTRSRSCAPRAAPPISRPLCSQSLQQQQHQQTLTRQNQNLLKRIQHARPSVPPASTARVRRDGYNISR